MSNQSFTVRPIGVVHSPYKERVDVPNFQRERLQNESILEIHSEYAEGLKDIEGFSHLIILFFFDREPDTRLLVNPPLDKESTRGVFATRAPCRPSHIGMTVVRFKKREENQLHVYGLDALDNTPIIDIKPYVHRDIKNEIKIGWLEGRVNE